LGHFGINLRTVFSCGKEKGMLTIRFATPGDLPCLTALFDAYRVFYGLESNPAAAGAFLSARLARDESVVLLAVRSTASDDEEIVGFAQLFRAFSSLSLGSVIVLNDLFVAPHARRLGLGGQLIDAATAFAKRESALRLTLETRPDNAAALSLYHAKGFVGDNEYAHMSLTVGG
jgi:GNAT superfamily N-acetyltransferase